MNRILVIDDDEIIQNVLEKVLTKEGHHVEIAKNGKEGLQKLDLMPYEIVITDLMMPYANGFEIISKLKQHPNTEKSSIIVISSITQEDSVMDSFKLGVDEYIRKPMMVGELLLRVNKLLANRSKYA